MATKEEIERRKRKMAEAGARADRMIAETTRFHQERIAAAIHRSIANAPAAISVEEALEMLRAFDAAECPEDEKFGQLGQTALRS